MATDFYFLEKSLLFKRALAVVNCRRDRELPAITYLKAKQVDCLRSCLDEDKQRKDLLAVLATGYGKSLLFELIPVFCELVNGLERPPITLLMSPLNAIIEQQLKVFGKQAKRLSSGEFCMQFIIPWEIWW